VYYIYTYTLQHVGPLLFDDREKGGYTRAVSGQRLGEHVPVARQQIINNETVGLQQWTRCVSTWSVPRSYLEDNCSEPLSSVRESVKK
jgi:hypothetical protein